MTNKIRKRATRSFVLLVLATLALLLLTTLMAYAARSSEPHLGREQSASSFTAGPIAITPTGPFRVYLPAVTAFRGLPDSGCPAIAGWQGQYWNNTTLSGNPLICRDDPEVAFQWAQGSPDSRLPVEGFSVRWKRIVPLAAGHYIFHLAGDDGLRLQVDGSVLIDRWQIQATTEYTAALDLAGGPHLVQVDYYENTGNAEVSLWWEGPENVCSGLQAQYYPNIDLSGTPSFTRCEGWVIDDSWDTTGPGGGLGGTNFSVRWTGQTSLISGTYTFVAGADDGVRLRLDGQLLIDAWKAQPYTEYRAVKALDAGNHDIAVEYYQQSGAAAAQFHFERRELPPGVVISQKQGFDMCAFPTVSQLQTWWNSSPYREINFYLGGSVRACNQPNLTAQNVAAAHEQGWNFIPTWVGPQAWCTAGAGCVSNDPATAHSQGRAEADAAAAAAIALGLPSLGGQGGSTEIYYDMESYTGDQARRNAISAFLTGWVARLHELGLRAGVYASPCSGYISDWATNSPAPDDIWPAVWNYTRYNTAASVWGLACLSDTLWPDHQRIHQYTGGHDETWGGLTLNIDSSVLDGHVAGDNTRPVSPALSTAAPALLAPAPTLDDIRSVQLLSSGQGWVLRGTRLFWTADGGNAWADITPALPGAGTIRSAHYLDPDHGWLLMDAASAEGFVVARTADGGKSWAPALLTGASAAEAASGLAPANFSFVDADTGWLALRLPSSSNFSRGVLFGTRDGGQTWTELALPMGGPVRFVDGNHGWTAGGPAGDELYVTRDGGHTWQRQDVAAAPAGASLFYALPDFSDSLNGSLAVTIASQGAEAPGSHIAVYRTSDGGQTWQAEASLPAAGPAQPGGPAPETLSPSGWKVADPGSGRLWAEAAAGAAQQLTTTGELIGAIDLQYGNGGLGWALTEWGSCTGDKNGGTVPFQCVSRRALLRTSDGGLTWSEVAP